MGVATAFFEPASGGMIPAIVSRDNLTAANSKIVGTRMGAALFAPIIGASIYFFAGIIVLFLINGTSFIISAISELFISNKHEEQKTDWKVASIFGDLKDGLKVAASQHYILKMIVYFFILSLLLVSAVSSFIKVPVQTILQTETPVEYISRVFSLVAIVV